MRTEAELLQKLEELREADKIQRAWISAIKWALEEVKA